LGVHGIYLHTDNAKEIVQLLPQMENLTSLNNFDLPIDQTTLECLPKLRHFTYNNVDEDVDSVPTLSRITSLRSLSFEDPRLVDQLPTLSLLTSLVFDVDADAPRPTLKLDGNLLCGLTQLRKLDLPMADFIGDSISALVVLTRLEYLSFDDDHGITEEILSHFPLMKDMDIRNSDVTLPTLTNLTHLSLYDSGIKGNLHTLTNLTDLYLEGHSMRDESLSRLPSITKLHLRTAYTTISDASISLLTNLETLIVRGDIPNITDEGISSLTNLRELNSERNRFTDRGISRLTHLEVLFLPPSPEITDEGISRLPHLIQFIANGNHSNDGISHLTNLRILNLANGADRITPDVIDHLPLLEKIFVRKSEMRRWKKELTPFTFNKLFDHV